MSTSGGNWKDLLKAAQEGDKDIVRFHLQRGVDPNFQHPEYFTTPLCTAIRAGHLPIVKILVHQGGADPGLVEELSCDSPLDIALHEQQHKIVEYLNTVLPKEQRFRVHNVLVTGGNRGIGKAICKRILKQGHCVRFTCRDAVVAKAVAAELAQETGNDKIDFIVGTLNSVKDAFELVSNIEKRFPEVDRLILNAGMWPTEKVINVDGLEESFMVNYMAQYILCNELLPRLASNGPSRVVFVGAGLFAMGRADLDLTPTGKDFSRFRTYGNTKQCQVILMSYFSRQVDTTKVTINAVHPGVVATGLGQTNWWVTNCLLRLVKRFWMSPDDGAVAPCWLALDSENVKVNGAFFNIKEQVKLKLEADEVTQNTWIQWTRDFLARSKMT